MKNEDIENLLDITYRIICDENKDIRQCENKIEKIKGILDMGNDMLFQIEKLNERMTDSLIVKKKEYFLNHIEDFTGISTLSPKMRKFLVERITLDCSDETEFIKGNEIYEICFDESGKTTESVRRNLGNEAKKYFERFLELLTEIEGIRRRMFFESMLMAGLYLRKIEDFRY